MAAADDAAIAIDTALMRARYAAMRRFMLRH